VAILEAMREDHGIFSKTSFARKSARLLFHLSYDFSVCPLRISVCSALNIACKSFNAEGTEIRRVRRED
jgi:hypothetical protein